MRPWVGYGLFFGGLATAAIGGVALYRRNRGLGYADRAVDQAPIVSQTRNGGMTLTHRRSAHMTIDQRVRTIQNLVWQSIQDPQMRKLALQITKHCPERDGACEAKAIYDFTKKHVRYTGDVAPVKMGADGPVEGVDFFQSAARTVEFGGEDCFPLGTKLLTDKFELAPVERLIIGQKIWGRDAWTTVQDVWYKGVRAIDAVQLNNGSWFRATPDHKVYVGICDRHIGQENGHGCSCDLRDRRVERIHVSELAPGMVMVTPQRLDFGSEALGADRAYVEGLYVADGWSSHNSRFDISGRDGKRKEAQKRAVEEACERLGVKTSWHDKHISVLDPTWADRVRLMGTHAPDKHLLSINLDEASAAATIRGLMADSDIRDSAFTTTSPVLATQMRLLYKMFGTNCGARYIADHGGLGSNPIWRLYPRRSGEPDAWSSKKLLRVRSVERNVAEVPVYDLQTGDHYVYLPEADVTVSNCDGHAILNATLLSLNGITAMERVTKPTRLGDWAHIYTVAGLPKLSPRKWVALDTTLPGRNNFGREVPYASKIDYPA